MSLWHILWFLNSLISWTGKLKTNNSQILRFSWYWIHHIEKLDSIKEVYVWLFLHKQDMVLLLSFFQLTSTIVNYVGVYMYQSSMSRFIGGNSHCYCTDSKHLLSTVKNNAITTDVMTLSFTETRHSTNCTRSRHYKFKMLQKHPGIWPHKYIGLYRRWRALERNIFCLPKDFPVL